MSRRFQTVWVWALALGWVVVCLPLRAEALFVVNEPWVRLSRDGRSAEIYMELRSSEGATLVAVRSDVSGDVKIRKPGGSGAAAHAVSLPAGVLVVLAPGGYRLAMAKLNRRLALGDRVDLYVTIESTEGARQEIPVSAEVRRHSPTQDHTHQHRH